MIAPSCSPDPIPCRGALRAEEAADWLGISLRTLMALVAENKVPHAYVGTRNLRFPLKGLQAYLDKQTNWPAEMTIANSGLPSDDLSEEGGQR